MPNWTKEQQQAIFESGQNIIVSAGAGSGKTAVLTERVIQKIEQGVNINELLILTFTNAAAKEMKNRIRKELKGKNLKSQLDLIDGAFITTFDSFALSIVKKYHYLLNISRNVDIADSTIINLEKEKIIDDIFNEMYDNKNELFLKLINDFCTKDDNDIRNYILNIDEKLNLKIDKQSYLDKLLKETFKDEFINSKVDKYAKLIVDKKNEIKNILEEISYVADGNYYSILEDSLSNLINSNDYNEIKKLLDVKMPNVPKGSPDELKELKKKISDLIKNLKELFSYTDLNEIKDEILLTYDYVTIICDIIKKLDNKINSFKLKNELFEFYDIAKMSINVIRSNEDVKEDVKNKFKEIMIDEYQDTSDLQELFVSLIENKNVYMVGDIKQSIYRFRNANPNIFKFKYDKYSHNNEGLKIDLNKNFRSRDEVVKNINLIFNSIMDDNIGGASYEQSHQMIFGNDKYEENKPKQNYNMQIMKYDYEVANRFSKEEIEYFTVCTDITDKIKSEYLIYDKELKDYRKCKYSDFCILIDRSTSFELGKKIFEYMKIPISIYFDESITKSYDLALIKNILKLMNKEIHKVYDTNYKYLFMSIARSFLFSYDDNKIFDIITNNRMREDIIIDKIKLLIKNIDNKSISEILVGILKEFNFYEKIINLGNIEDSMVRFEYLYNISKSLESLGYGLEEFEKYLSDVNEKDYDIKLSTNKDDSNSVKLMTIHKSKGLEFSVCYFIGLDKAFNLSEIKDRFIYSDNYGIITPYYKNGIGKNIYVDLLKNEYLLEEISEKIRLFYVALTRAKEKMIFILPNNIKKSDKTFNLDERKNYRSFADIIYSLNENLEEYSEKIDLNVINLTKDYNKIIKDKKNLNKTSEKMEFKENKINISIVEKNTFSKTLNELITKDIRSNLDLGLLFHEYLEYMDFKNPNFDIIENNFIKEKIKRFLNNKLLENIINCKIYKESEFEYEENNTLYHGIIDLLIEHDNYIDIIDYKLKYTLDDNYKRQLFGYKTYINKISNKPVNIYLYSIIDEELKKIDI